MQQFAFILPPGPFILSTHPGIGSLMDPATIEGLTIEMGKCSLSWFTSCSVIALLKV